MIARSLFLLFLVSLSVAAGQPERGRLLYESFCHHCHISEIHYRVHSKVESLEQLRHQVWLWQAEMGLGWRAEEIDDVAAWLDWAYYRLPARAPTVDEGR